MNAGAGAQGFTTTTVQGTVYQANGQPGSGTLQLSWPAFTTANNQAVAAGRTNVAIGADGYVSVTLAPNQGSTPAGLYYTAVYHLNDGTTSTEYWTVPAAAQASLSQVRAQVMPAAQAVQAVSKGYVDQSIAELTQSLLTSSGGTLSGPLFLNGDPGQPMQAATKRYVDNEFSMAVPLTGAVMSGPLTSVQLGAAYQVDQFSGADFGARLQSCLNRLDGVYGGTCDARNFSGTQSMGAPVVIGTANATVQLPCATIATAQQVQISAGTRNVTLRGCALRGASNASGSQGGTVFLYSGSGPMIQVGDSAYATDTLGFHLDNVVINTTASADAGAQGLAAYRTQELELESIYFLGNSNQTGMTLDGTGNYTGGTFQDLEFGGFGTAVNGIGHQVTNPAATDWLNASTFVRLHIDCPTNGGSPVAGTYGINLAQGDGNTFTGGDVEGCATALHLGSNAQNNTIIGLRNENSGSQVVADAGSSYNNWITGGTMFTGKLTDNGTRNSFLDTFHRSFNSLNGDWYGSQQDATVTNHFRMGTGTGNERGLLNRFQTDYGYRWTTGLSDGMAGEQFYQILDELNNVYRISIGQYNHGQSSTNNQTVINAAGTGAIVLNGSANSGSGGVIFGAGGSTGAAVATINNAGNAQFSGTLAVGGPSTFTSTTTVKNQADAEIDSVLWAGTTANQKESFTYKDYTGASQWYMVKDANNNWALNSATGGLDSFKAYQSNNSGDTYINASNGTGHIRLNYETGSGNETDIYSGSSSGLIAAFLGTTAIKFPGLAASSGHGCLQIDNSGYVSNSGAACGTGSGINGTVNAGSAGQVAYYASNGTVIAGTTSVAIAAGGTGGTTAGQALQNLGAQPAMAGVATDGASGMTVSGNLTASTVTGSVNGKYNPMAPPVGSGNTAAKGDCSTDDSTAFTQAQLYAAPRHMTIEVPTPPGGCYKANFTFYGASMQGQPSGFDANGNQNVIIQGYTPGVDVMHGLDPTSNNITTYQKSWSIDYITFKVDDSAAGSYPHRWPGRWGDGGSIASGSAVYTPGNEGMSCGDIGQPIRIVGAGVSGADLVTTVASVIPCFPVVGGQQTVTLAASASTTRSSNAHTYVSIGGLPVTTNVGPCGMAWDMTDGNPSNWATTNSNIIGNWRDHLHNVVFASTTNANNSCSIYVQGGWGFYQMSAQDVMTGIQPFGAVFSTDELNSYYQGGGMADFEVWNHIRFQGGGYPWISYGGGFLELKDVEATTGNGPQILCDISDRWAGGCSGDVIEWKEQEGGGGAAGTRIEVNGRFDNSILAGPGTLQGIFGGSQSSCLNCATGPGGVTINGSNNKMDINIQPGSPGITDMGRGNKVENTYPYTGGSNQSQSIAGNIYKGDGVANELSTDFLTSGNAATPWKNNSDLWLWPQDLIANTVDGCTSYTSCVVADSTVPITKAYLNWTPNGGSGLITYSWAQFEACGGTNYNAVVGACIPATKVTIYYSGMCPSGPSFQFSGWVTGGGGLQFDQTSSCTTAYQTYSVTADLSGVTLGRALGFGNNGSNTARIAWIAIVPYQNANRINGGTVPASANVLGSNASGQPVSASSAQIQSAIGSGVYDASGAAAGKAGTGACSAGQFETGDTTGGPTCASVSTAGLPAVVATVNDTAYTGTTDPGTILTYTTANDGKKHVYQVLYWEVITTASTSGGNSYAQFQSWTYNGTSFYGTRLTGNIATTTLNNIGNAASTIVADPNTTLSIYIILGGVSTGTPTIHYAVKLLDMGVVQ